MCRFYDRLGNAVCYSAESCRCQFFLLCVADYSGSYGSSEDDDTSPCDKVLTNRKGQTDFRVKSLKHANIGRKVIGIAEQGTSRFAKISLWQIRYSAFIVMRQLEAVTKKLKHCIYVITKL